MYTIRKKSTNTYKHCSYKTFSANLDKAKVFTSLEGAKYSAGWAIHYDTSTRHTSLLLIPSVLRQQYEIVKYEATEKATIRL